METIISFSQLKEQSIFFGGGKFNLNKFLPNHEIYLAHLPPSESPAKNKETLEEHLNLVIRYFDNLVRAYALEPCINNLIHDFLPEKLPQNLRIKLASAIKKLFLYVVIYHDFGKVNHLFQVMRMKNDDIKIPVVNHNFKHYHAGLGAYLFAIHHYFDNDFEGENLAQDVIDFVITVFTYPILKHHSAQLQSPFDNINFSPYADGFIEYLKFFQKEINDEELLSTLQEEFIKKTSDKLSQIFHGDIENPGLDKLIANPFPLYALIKLNFSLLTAADYLATGEYMNDIKLTAATDFGVLSRDRVQEIVNNIEKKDFLDSNGQKENYNKKTYQQLDKFKFKRPKLPSNENLNILRQEMAVEVIQNIRQHSDKNLFYIEAPTGGGKTNLSMLATVELLKANPELNKVFYVFPFTTLITQTYTSIKETLGLHDNELIQLHSKAGIKTLEKGVLVNNAEEAKDGSYGDEKKNYIDNLFINFPFCLLSHIKFFDILKTNEKETNYLMHSLANSVVVIDELQSYNPSHWDKVVYFIRHYADFFNIRFILMSATLPKLSKLKLIENQTEDFVYLLSDAKENYFQNANFKERVKFNFSLLQKKNISSDTLAKEVLSKSKAYAVNDFGKAKPLGSVYTIIEFIYKKSATAFYHTLKPLNDFFDEIFVLSGTILEHRRKYIINFLKNPANRKKKILLITTQVVEAGVDIDMDVGFKNKSLIDSDEQLAGRINRNVNKDICELHIFNIDEAGVLYNKDKRYQETKKLAKEYEEILINKDFDRLYNLVLEGIEKWNNTTFAINFSDYEINFRKLNFQQVHQQFKLIEQDNLSIFVPLAIPVNIHGANTHTQDPIFSKAELSFLQTAEIFPNADDKIEGEQVFKLYTDLLNNKKGGFIQKKISLKTLQGIMSKFIFSVFDDPKGKTRNKLIEYADIEKFKENTYYEQQGGLVFGFVYLSNYAKVYDEEFGLNDSKFDAPENCIL